MAQGGNSDLSLRQPHEPTILTCDHISTDAANRTVALLRIVRFSPPEFAIS
jgi:hypothetical protein